MQFECQRAAGQHESQVLYGFLNVGDLFHSSMARVGFPSFILECPLYAVSSSCLAQVFPYLEFFKQCHY